MAIPFYTLFKIEEKEPLLDNRRRTNEEGQPYKLFAAIP